MYRQFNLSRIPHCLDRRPKSSVFLLIFCKKRVNIFLNNKILFELIKYEIIYFMIFYGKLHQRKE